MLEFGGATLQLCMAAPFAYAPERFVNLAGEVLLPTTRARLEGILLNVASQLMISSQLVASLEQSIDTCECILDDSNPPSVDGIRYTPSSLQVPFLTIEISHCLDSESRRHCRKPLVMTVRSSCCSSCARVGLGARSDCTARHH